MGDITGTDSFTVAVRVRPFQSANDSNEKRVVSCLEKVILVEPLARPGELTIRRKQAQFAFDRVFDEDASQLMVYSETVKPLIPGLLDGYNATVFAYGATGCGKTYTITGTKQNPGIIYQTIKNLFDLVGDSVSTKVSISFLEVYNETIRDLLSPSNGQNLDLREDESRVVVAGLSEHTPRDLDHVMSMLIRGNENRTKAPTEANAASSRSHAVLQITVKRPSSYAVLSIIDLAGSERAAVTKNKGDRLFEGANINRSLLALGNCINALCSGKSHIPYRDSKLTRLLKFSLSGNCRVVMIANVSPSSLHYEETINTLKYANRAKNIKVTIQRNSVDVELAMYPKIITDLQSEIGKLQQELKNAQSVQQTTTVPQLPLNTGAIEKLIAKLGEEYAHLTNKNEAHVQQWHALSCHDAEVELLMNVVDYLPEHAPLKEPILERINGLEANHVTLTHNLNQLESSIQETRDRIKALSTSEKFKKLPRDVQSIFNREREILELRLTSNHTANQLKVFRQSRADDTQRILGLVTSILQGPQVAYNKVLEVLHLNQAVQQVDAQLDSASIYMEDDDAESTILASAFNSKREQEEVVDDDHEILRDISMLDLQRGATPGREQTPKTIIQSKSTPLKKEEEAKKEFTTPVAHAAPKIETPTTVKAVNIPTGVILDKSLSTTPLATAQAMRKPPLPMANSPHQSPFVARMLERTTGGAVRCSPARRQQRVTSRRSMIPILASAKKPLLSPRSLAEASLSRLNHNVPSDLLMNTKTDSDVKLESKQRMPQENVREKKTAVPSTPVAQPQQKENLQSVRRSTRLSKRSVNNNAGSRPSRLLEDVSEEPESEISIAESGSRTTRKRRVRRPY